MEIRDYKYGKEAFEDIYDRNKNPFVITFVIAWISVNWKLWYITFFESEKSLGISKLKYIIKNSDPFSLIGSPILISIFAIISYAVMTWLFHKIILMMKISISKDEKDKSSKMFIQKSIHDEVLAERYEFRQENLILKDEQFELNKKYKEQAAKIAENGKTYHKEIEKKNEEYSEMQKKLKEDYEKLNIEYNSSLDLRFSELRPLDDKLNNKEFKFSQSTANGPIVICKGKIRFDSLFEMTFIFEDYAIGRLRMNLNHGMDLNRKTYLAFDEIKIDESDIEGICLITLEEERNGYIDISFHGKKNKDTTIEKGPAIDEMVQYSILELSGRHMLSLVKV